MSFFVFSFVHESCIFSHDFYLSFPPPVKQSGFVPFSERAL